MRTTTRVYNSPLRAPSALAPVSHKAAHLPARTLDSHLALAAPSTPFAAPSTPFPLMHSTASRAIILQRVRYLVFVACVLFCVARAVGGGGDDDPGETLVRVSDAAFSSSVDYRTSIISDPYPPACRACPPPPFFASHPLASHADDDTRIICQSHEGRKAQ